MGSLSWISALGEVFYQRETPNVTEISFWADNTWSKYIIMMSLIILTLVMAFYLVKLERLRTARLRRRSSRAAVVRALLRKNDFSVHLESYRQLADKKQEEKCFKESGSSDKKTVKISKRSSLQSVSGSSEDGIIRETLQNCVDKEDSLHLTDLNVPPMESELKQDCLSADDCIKIPEDEERETEISKNKNSLDLVLIPPPSVYEDNEHPGMELLWERLSDFSFPTITDEDSKISLESKISDDSKISLNETKMSLNESKMSLSDSKISLESKISINDSKISINDSKMSLNDSKMSLNESKMSLSDSKISLESKISINDSKISINDSKMSLNDSKMSLNESKMSLNESKMSLNDSKMSLNDSKMSLNDSKISLASKISINDSKISLNDSKMSLNESKMSLNESKMSLNESKISLNDSKISLNDSKISLNDSKISFNDSKISFNDSKISFNDSKISLSDSKISLESKISLNENDSDCGLGSFLNRRPSKNILNDLIEQSTKDLSSNFPSPTYENATPPKGNLSGFPSNIVDHLDALCMKEPSLLDSKIPIFVNPSRSSNTRLRNELDVDSSSDTSLCIKSKQDDCMPVDLNYVNHCSDFESNLPIYNVPKSNGKSPYAFSLDSKDVCSSKLPVYIGLY